LVIRASNVGGAPLTNCVLVSSEEPS